MMELTTALLMSYSDLVRIIATTQAQVAKKSGIAESTISEVLAGKRTLNRTQIGKLSRYSHITTGAFAG